MCTGTGLGAALSTCLQSPNWYLIWIGSDQEKTFGPTISGLIHQHIGPERLCLWDSKQRGGRPDVMKLVRDAYHSWKAEVVFITSNYQGNQEIMEGCKSEGIPAFVSEVFLQLNFALLTALYRTGYIMGLLINALCYICALYPLSLRIILFTFTCSLLQYHSYRQSKCRIYKYPQTIQFEGVGPPLIEAPSNRTVHRFVGLNLVSQLHKTKSSPFGYCTSRTR